MNVPLVVIAQVTAISETTVLPRSKVRGFAYKTISAIVLHYRNNIFVKLKVMLT